MLPLLLRFRLVVLHVTVGGLCLQNGILQQETSSRKAWALGSTKGQDANLQALSRLGSSVPMISSWYYGVEGLGKDGNFECDSGCFGDSQYQTSPLYLAFAEVTRSDLPTRAKKSPVQISEN